MEREDYADPAVPLPGWLDPYRLTAAGLVTMTMLVAWRLLMGARLT